MFTYEQQLNANRSWAFMEGSLHFEKESAVHKTLARFARRLEDLAIPYAVAGSMALFFHGYRRFTEDVDILVTREGLQAIHQRLDRLGCILPFTGSKDLRDAESGVRIEFLITGEYPGDGRPKPVAFPDPTAAATVIDGMHFLTLPRSIELKLASGMTNRRRLRDLADVQDVIERLQLPADFGAQLDEFVRPLFQQLWNEVHEPRDGPDKEHR